MKRILSLALLALTLPAIGQVPNVLSYQGRLTVDQQAFNGVGQFKFALVNADGSTRYWLNSADGNNDGEPDTAVLIAVSLGLYSTLIGDTTLPQMAALPATVFNNSVVYLRVWFSDGASAFERLSPDQRIAAVGYALMAQAVPDASITSQKLAPGTLTASNLSGVLSSAQIPNLDASKVNSGVFAAGQIPNLDAAKIISGVLPAARLPSNVAYKDTDLLTTSNSLVTQLTALSAQLTGQLSALSNQVKQASPSGLTVVSVDPSDPSLTSQGYIAFSSLAPAPWANGSAAGSPSAREGHAAVWTGDQMIVWGGSVGSGFVSASGAIYSASLDSWSAVSTVDAPSARSAHSAVWTGSEMVVWGGFSTQYENTGARFNPAPQAWTAVSTSGAPERRDSHVAVWTGSRMFVWGGRNSTGLVSTASLYNPLANQWTAVTLPNPPSSRAGAQAVWAGDRVIIWGGAGPEGSLNTGAQLAFDASGNPTQWQALTLNNAPDARREHTAIWTGSRLIIWGGRDGNDYKNDGASYDPIAGVWQKLSLNNAPAARSFHNALWTGHEMLILHGRDSENELASGAAYKPSTDQWRTLTAAGSPVARLGAVAVWTGAEVILFGGESDGSPVAALQRLDPKPAWHFFRKP